MMPSERLSADGDVPLWAAATVAAEDVSGGAAEEGLAREPRVPRPHI